jgi:hypothetical protein
MRSLRRVLDRPIHHQPIDAWLSQWGSWAGGLILWAGTALVMPAQRASRAELALALGLASVTFANLVLFGVLSRRVHLAWHRRAAPWRSRIGELMTLALSLGIVVGGYWFLSALELNPPGMIIGGLLTLSLAIATMCLGQWSTLSTTC